MAAAVPFRSTRYSATKRSRLSLMLRFLVRALAIARLGRLGLNRNRLPEPGSQKRGERGEQADGELRLPVDAARPRRARVRAEPHEALGAHEDPGDDGEPG